MRHIRVKSDDHINPVLRAVCHLLRTNKEVSVSNAYEVNMKSTFDSLSLTKKKELKRDLQGFMRIMDIMYDYDMVSGTALDNYVKVSACIKGNLERAEEE